MNDQYYQNQQMHQPTMSSHPAFQPGFAGTDAEEVARRNSLHGGMGMSHTTAMGQSYQGQMMHQPMMHSHAAYQPGFAGTNAEEVARQNSQSAMGMSTNYGMNTMGAQTQGHIMHQPMYGSHAVYQPGFAGTNAAEVARQNSQMGYNQYQSHPSYQTGAATQSYIQPMTHSSYTNSGTGMYNTNPNTAYSSTIMHSNPVNGIQGSIPGMHSVNLNSANMQR